MAFHALKNTGGQRKASAIGAATATLLGALALPALAQQDSGSTGYVLGEGLQLGQTV